MSSATNSLLFEPEDVVDRSPVVVLHNGQCRKKTTELLITLRKSRNLRKNSKILTRIMKGFAVRLISCAGSTALAYALSYLITSLCSEDEKVNILR